ncbi:MAG: leucine-rich repeat domain-containing protein [Lewinellaceae bacterium]|nr:leucine-rich repeat domain-containing protein [Lewinellaceae bacterium]
MEKLTNLHALDLSNQISDYSFWKKLTNLHTLILSYNQITDIRFLEKLTNLHTLGLSSNQITDIRFFGKADQPPHFRPERSISDIRIEKADQIRSPITCFWKS